MTDKPSYQVGIRELRKMDSNAIVAALRTGRFDSLLAGRDPGPPDDHDDQADDDQTKQLGRDDIATMSETEIARALKDGRFDRMLAGQ